LEIATDPGKKENKCVLFSGWMILGSFWAPKMLGKPSKPIRRKQQQQQQQQQQPPQQPRPQQQPQQQQQIHERPTERQWTQNQSSQKTLFRMELKDRPSDSGAKSALKRVIDACGTFRRTET
jgi:hypothetical protein